MSRPGKIIREWFVGTICNFQALSLSGVRGKQNILLSFEMCVKFGNSRVSVYHLKAEKSPRCFSGRDVSCFPIQFDLVSYALNASTGVVFRLRQYLNRYLKQAVAVTTST